MTKEKDPVAELMRLADEYAGPECDSLSVRRLALETHARAMSDRIEELEGLARIGGLSAQQLKACSGDNAVLTGRIAVLEHQAAAYELLLDTKERREARQVDIDQLRDEAVVTLQSERAANALLTAQVEQLERQLEAVGAGGIGPQILKGIGKINGDGWKDKTSKGEVVFAYAKELPSPYAKGQHPRVGNVIWSASAEQYDFVPATCDEVQDFVESRLATQIEVISILTNQVKQLDCQLEAVGVGGVSALIAPTVAPVYLVATGQVHNGLETYTRHDACPPLCDVEKLYSSAPMPKV